MRAAAVLLAAATLPACMGESYRDASVPMTTEARVDLDRYAGRWFEIARFPVSFEEGCAGVTATYDPRADGTIGVTNRCEQGGLGGPVDIATATAEAADATNAKLKVDFVPYVPFTAGDYWILDVDEGYRTAVIGVPAGWAGWILAREPRIDRARLDRALGVLEANGYDTSRITYTEQPAAVALR